MMCSITENLTEVQYFSAFIKSPSLVLTRQDKIYFNIWIIFGFSSNFSSFPKRKVKIRKVQDMQEYNPTNSINTPITYIQQHPQKASESLTLQLILLPHQRTKSECHKRFRLFIHLTFWNFSCFYHHVYELCKKCMHI